MHNWKSPPSRFRGPSPPLLGIHSQSFTWPACTTTGHPLPAIYVAPQAPAPPLLGIQPSRLRGPSAATGYPLPAISAARPRFYCMWVSTPSHLRGPLLPLLGIQPSHCRYCMGIHSQPFTWPRPRLRHYWVSNPAVYVAHLPLLGIHSQPSTARLRHYWVSTPSHLRGPSRWSATTVDPSPAVYVARLRPPIAGNHSHPIDHFPPLGGPLAAHVQLRLTRRRCGRQ